MKLVCILAVALFLLYGFYPRINYSKSEFYVMCKDGVYNDFEFGPIPIGVLDIDKTSGLQWQGFKLKGKSTELQVKYFCLLKGTPKTTEYANEILKESEEAFVKENRLTPIINMNVTYIIYVKSKVLNYSFSLKY